MNEIETFYGLVENTLDALRIFQMCRDGRLHRVRRRLHERERRLIRSGSVFVFDEEESGIRRWTDGRLWSPSRILGNFLIYRELEKKGSSSSGLGKGRSLKRPLPSSQKPTQFISHSAQGKVPKILPKAAENLDMLWGLPREDLEDTDEYYAEEVSSLQTSQSSPSINPQELLTPPTTAHRLKSYSPTKRPIDPTSGESLRVLKSKKLSNNHKGRYIFKADGLIKKTISIQLEGHTHHLVAYYSLEDFCKGHLQLNEALNEITELSSEPTTESSSSNFSHPPFDAQLMEILRQVPIPVDLMLQQNFRKPAALLASATSTAQNLMANAGDPERGEKLITALEYGAINPSDLQTNQQTNNQSQPSSQSQTTRNSSYVPGGGIIFSSSPTTTNNSTSTTSTTTNSSTFSRPRRHSSFHPSSFLQPTNIDIIDSLNLLDESSQLSGEALEFLSHFSDEQEDDPTTNFLRKNDSLPLGTDSALPEDSFSYEFSDNLEEELFSSILSPSEGESDNPSNSAIRGQDVLLSDTMN